MNFFVYGLQHLGLVTAACAAEAGHCVGAIDLDETVVSDLQAGRVPIFEPELDDLIARNLRSGRLLFSTDLSIVESAKVVWVCFDTPVDEDDIADVDWVVNRIVKLFPFLADGSIVLISSQLPVGTIRRLEAAYARSLTGSRVRFACSPENLRLGQAVKNFSAADRIVIGVRDEETKTVLEPMLATFSNNLIWVGVESAEMVKHAINCFLATSIIFTNELARICERAEADASEVERSLRTEPRIGARAYVRAGGAIGGGTLLRDVRFLIQLAREHGIDVPLFEAIPDSNDQHKSWPVARVKELVSREQKDAKVAVLGLSYKPDTDNTRRSLALQICRELLSSGYSVSAFDPKVKSLPSDLAAVRLEISADAALKGASAAIIATEWPEFKETVTPDQVGRSMSEPIVIDQGGLLSDRLRGAPGLRYVSVGRRS